MNNLKVRPIHLQRNAYLYIRQSSLKQVAKNTESTKRQYALRQQAVALGWPLEQICLIDSDMGQSGASKERSGFKQLVAEVSLGRAGVVLGLEVSRLARSSTEWHRLLEICALTDTLILDEDGIYNPNDFNDRLVLGLKGTMSEAELHILRSRMRGGVLSKAERGELKMPLPIGFVYDEQDQVVLDPDSQVQETIRFLFKTFCCCGSAFSTVRVFNEQGLQFPKRMYRGFRTGDLVWSPITHSNVRRVLHNPRYAGAFFYGRTKVQQNIDGTKSILKLPEESWHSLIPDAHQGYISLEEFRENQKTLQQNAQAYGYENRKSPPREGNALLQGLALCAACGSRMTVRYHSGPIGIVPNYICQKHGIEHAEKICQSIPGAALDSALSKLLLEIITPLALEVTLAVQEELNARAQEVRNLHSKRLEGLRYEAELAKRRFLRVDPDNRLVADELEADWNAKLRALSEAQDEFEKLCRQTPENISSEERSEILRIATDFTRLWEDKNLPDRERKRIIRLIVEDASLLKNGRQITAKIRFKGGATKELVTMRTPNFFETFRTDPEVVQEIDRLLENHSEIAIAAILNEKGYISGRRTAFTPNMVSAIRRRHGLKDRYTRFRETGMLTLDEIVKELGVSTETVKKMRKKGLLKGQRARSELLFEKPDQDFCQQLNDQGQNYIDTGATVSSSSTGGAV